MIARAATAQDDITGDGTTTVVLLIGELLKQADRYTTDRVHPRDISDGIELAKIQALKFLDTFATPLSKLNGNQPAATLLKAVALASLRTKLPSSLAEPLATVVTDALLTIQRPNKPVDLFMVEVMTMQEHTTRETVLVKGIVMDHGARHPDMPRALTGEIFVLTCNVSLEYEKTYVSPQSINHRHGP